MHFIVGATIVTAIAIRILSTDSFVQLEAIEMALFGIVVLYLVYGLNHTVKKRVLEELNSDLYQNQMVRSKAY